MEIAYKGIIHERTEDAPFVGALIVAPSCRLRCNGCHNKHIKKQDAMYATVEDIIKEVKSNPFNEGIILGGLEWSENAKEMIILLEEASKNDLQIMIYTGLELPKFHEIIGKECADLVGLSQVQLPEFLRENDGQLYEYIGACVLDYYVPQDYYVKTGRYDKNHLSKDRVHFGVRLASDNQNVFLIKKNEETDAIGGEVDVED